MTDEELRDLQERVQAIRDMSSHNGWVYAADRIRAQIFMRQKQILLGKAKSYDEYREMVAYTDGLSFAMNLPEMVERELEVELVKRAEEE